MHATELTFGVEIETLIGSDKAREHGLRIGGYHAGRQVPYLPEGWIAMHDSSLRGSRRELSCEIVSPILRGSEGLRQVKQVLDALREKGHRVNATCGVHVHVHWDPAQRTSAELSRLVLMCSYLETALYAITGTTRRERGAWCGSVRRYGDVENFRQRAMRYRYHVLNLYNLATGRKPTVEFRAFSGSLDPVKVIGWIMVCLGCVQKSVDVRITNQWTPRAEHTPTKAVSNLFYYLGWNKSGRRNLRGRSFGWIDDNPIGFDAIRKAFQRLARQYTRERNENANP